MIDPDAVDALLGSLLSQVNELAEQLGETRDGQLSALLLGRLLFLSEELAVGAAELAQLSARVRGRLVDLYRFSVLEQGEDTAEQLLHPRLSLDEQADLLGDRRDRDEEVVDRHSERLGDLAQPPRGRLAARLVRPVAGHAHPDLRGGLLLVETGADSGFPDGDAKRRHVRFTRSLPHLRQNVPRLQRSYKEYGKSANFRLSEACKSTGTGVSL